MFFSLHSCMLQYWSSIFKLNKNPPSTHPPTHPSCNFYLSITYLNRSICHVLFLREPDLEHFCSYFPSILTWLVELSCITTSHSWVQYILHLFDYILAKFNRTMQPMDTPTYYLYYESTHTPYNPPVTYQGLKSPIPNPNLYESYRTSQPLILYLSLC